MAVAGRDRYNARTVRPGCIALGGEHTQGRLRPVLVTGVVLAVGSFALEWMFGAHLVAASFSRWAVHRECGVVG